MERYQEIEQTIKTTYHHKLYTPFIKALKEYKLLEPNDKVCVCISGGKDSMLMAKLFQLLLEHSDFYFEVKYLVMNPGYNQENLDLIKHNLKELNIPAEIIDSDIFQVSNKQEENACYLCARMRRGCLYTLAKKMGCNKIALGHHYDDVIITTVMGMLNAGVYQTMLPKLHSTHFDGMELIRPLYFIREQDIIDWADENNLKFIQCACRFTESSSQEKLRSQRKETKKLIQKMLEYNEYAEKNIFKSASNVNVNMVLEYKKDGIRHSFLDEYDDYKEIKDDGKETDKETS